MTNAQALKRAVEKFGKKARVRDGGAKFYDGSKRPNAEEREVLSAELKDLRANKPQHPDINSFGDSRTVGEYREALRDYSDRYNVWKKRTDWLVGACIDRRYSVGTWSEYGLMHTLGSGDTWEEAFAQAEK
jgi:hypothetical protein